MQITQGTTPTILILLVSTADDRTAVLGATPAVQLSKVGGAFVPAAGAVTEVGQGFYKLTLQAGETDTIGALAVVSTATGADVWRSIEQVV